MLIIISLTIFSVVPGWTESSTESLGKNVTLKDALKLLKLTTPIDYADINPHLQTLWVTNPVAQIQSQIPAMDESRQVLFRNRHTITKIAKTFSDRMDPFFGKEIFGPFERRPKPITLIAFRKKGLFPRLVVESPLVENSMEIAEQQSPYNDISSFWSD